MARACSWSVEDFNLPGIWQASKLFCMYWDRWAGNSWFGWIAFKNLAEKEDSKLASGIPDQKSYSITILEWTGFYKIKLALYKRK